jgi:hypothetical protein
MDVQDWNDVGRLFGAMFFAVLAAIGPEASAIACDSLRRATGNDLAEYPELQRIIWCTLNVVDPVEDDHSEWAAWLRELDAGAHRARSRPIAGGLPDAS